MLESCGIGSPGLTERSVLYFLVNAKASLLLTIALRAMEMRIMTRTVAPRLLRAFAMLRNATVELPAFWSCTFDDHRSPYVFTEI